MVGAEGVEGSVDVAMDTEAEFHVLVVDAIPSLKRRSKALSREADDLSQATLLRALRHRSSFDKRRPMGPWLRAIAGRVAQEVPRDSTADVMRLAGGVGPQPFNNLSRDPAEIVDDGSLSPEFEAAWRGLPLRQRATLWLCVVDGFSISEAAQILGEAPKAVESRLLRAKARFRTLFAGRSSGPAAFVLWVARSPVATHRLLPTVTRTLYPFHPAIAPLVLALLALVLLVLGEPA
jgi:RNA polymerase sigma factor (sigma-70 family)